MLFRPSGEVVVDRAPGVWTLAHRGYSGSGRLDVWAYPAQHDALAAGALLAMHCGLDEDPHAVALYRQHRHQAVLDHYEQTHPDGFLLRVQPALLISPDGQLDDDPTLPEDPAATFWPTDDEHDEHGDEDADGLDDEDAEEADEGDTDPWPASPDLDPPASSRARVHQLTVSLDEVSPRVWRRLQVPSTITLTQLHTVLQAAMGWQDLHLHRFAWDPGWRDGELDETATLAEIAGAGDRLGYVYDFGDNWWHDITVDKILTRPRRGNTYPRCLAGRRTCPPEDTGGPTGYAWLLAGLRHRKGHRYHQARDALGSGFDPAVFDCNEVNARLAALDPDLRVIIH